MRSEWIFIRLIYIWTRIQKLYFFVMSNRYIENDGGSLTVSKENGKDAISGRFSCNYKDQKYNIVDGKVVVDGEPFIPVYD